MRIFALNYSQHWEDYNVSYHQTHRSAELARAAYLDRFDEPARSEIAKSYRVVTIEVRR